MPILWGAEDNSCGLGRWATARSPRKHLRSRKALSAKTNFRHQSSVRDRLSESQRAVEISAQFIGTESCRLAWRRLLRPREHLLLVSECSHGARFKPT